MTEVVIIEKSPNVSYEEIQKLLHDAHQSNVKNNLIYATANQSVEKLKEKIGDGVCLVALYDGHLAGTVTMSFRELSYWYFSGEVAIIKLLGVSPEYKGKNISSLLVKECIKIASERKLRIIVSDSAEKNTIIKNLYYKHGFLRVDVCKYAANNFYSAVYAKWINEKAPNKLYCKLRYYLKKIFIMTKFRNPKSGRK